jgi:hypothetical protein
MRGASTRWRLAPWAGDARDEPPLKILDRRLAEGKISVEDYEQRKEILAGDDERSTD